MSEDTGPALICSTARGTPKRGLRRHEISQAGAPPVRDASSSHKYVGRVRAAADGHG